MTAPDAILAAVLAAPDADTPRLVYADWCDDHGQPERAAFIRVQVELARLIVRPLAEVMLHPNPASSQAIGPGLVSGTLGGSPEGVVAGATVDWTASAGLDQADWFYTGVGVVESVGQDRYGLRVRLRPIPNEGSRPERDAARAKRRELRVRARQLFATAGQWQHEWAGPAAPVIPGQEWDDRLSWFSRGFIETVVCSAADWLAHADAIVKAHPVRAVALTTLPAGMAAGFAAHWFADRWPRITFMLPPSTLELQAHRMATRVAVSRELLADAATAMLQAWTLLGDAVRNAGAALRPAVEAIAEALPEMPDVCERCGAAEPDDYFVGVRVEGWFCSDCYSTARMEE